MPLLVFTLVLLTPPGPTVPDGPVSAGTQWAVLQGTARVSNGESGAAASAVCLGTSGRFSYFLTASHAVPKGHARLYEFFTKESYPKPSHTYSGGEVVVRMDDPDLALVKVTTGVGAPPSVRVAGPGQRPKRYPFYAISIGCPAFSPPLARGERVTGKTLVHRSEDGDAFFWKVASPPVGGMSGGPLVDAEGRLIGVCSATQGGVGYYTHLDEILAGLRRHQYGWLLDQANDAVVQPVGR